MSKPIDIIRLAMFALVVAILFGCTGGGCSDPNNVNDSLNIFRPFYLYTANAGSNNVSMFRGAQDGSLTPLGTIAAGSSPAGIAIADKQRALYVVNRNDNNISMFRMRTNGTLEPMTPSTIATGTSPRTITMGSGRVFVACDGDNKIYMYRVNTSTGVLTLEQSIASNAGLRRVGISNAGGIYGLNFTANNITQYNQQPSGLTPYNPPTVATGAGPIDFGANTEAFFVLNQGANTITSYKTGIDDTRLTANGSVATPSNPVAMAITNNLNGNIAFVVSNGTDTISRYRVDDNTKQLTRVPGTDVSSGTDATDLVYKVVGARPFPRFLYTTNPNGKLRYYELSGDDEDIAFKGDYDTGTNPVAIATSQEEFFHEDLPIEILTTSLPNGATGTQYNQPILYGGGSLLGEESSPLVWTVNSGSLPPGLTLNHAGGFTSAAIVGTPTQGGTYNFSIRVGQGNQSDTQTYTVTVTGGTSNVTRGRVINAGFGVQNIDAYLHPIVQIADNLPYQSSTTYVDIPSGNQNLRVFKTSNQVSMFDATVSIGAGTRNAFVALGNATTAVDIAHVTKSSNYQPASGKAAIRFVNGFSNQAGSHDVVIVPTGGNTNDPAAVRVNVGAYKAVKLHELNPGTYDLLATPAGSSFIMFRTPITVIAGNQRIAVMQSPTNLAGSFLIVID